MIDGFQLPGFRLNGVANQAREDQVGGNADVQLDRNSGGAADAHFFGSGFGFGGRPYSLGGPQYPNIPPVPQVPRAGGYPPVNYNNGVQGYQGFQDFQNYFQNFFNNFSNNFSNGYQNGYQPVNNTGYTNGGLPGVSPNVVIIDQTDVSKAGIDLDGDGTKDRAHGTIVQDIIKAQVPNANISTVEIPNYEPATLTGLFNGVSQKVDSGQRVDAVNFSQQTFNDIGELAQVTGLPINQQNIGQYKDQIRQKLFNFAANPASFRGDPALLKKFTQWVPTIQAMDNLSAKGVPIYVAAGNDGAHQVNMFALANGVKVVGATDQNGRITEYTANNSLINTTELGNTRITAAFDSAGRVTGVDDTGDRRVDVVASELSGKGLVFDPNRDLTGTSFATPRALVDGLIQRSGVSFV